jgi:calcium-dependent protein kinase
MMDQPYFEIIKELLTDNDIKQINKSEIKVLKKCGEGAQSQVYKCEYNGEIVAMKVLSKIDIKCLIHEIAIISKIESENIPKFLGVILEETTFSYVTRFIPGVSLDEIDVNKVSYDDKVFLLKQISKTLNYIHKNNCIHRDLKAENIMVDTRKSKIYLIDFGISRILYDDTSIITRAKGTMNYLAPEIFDVKSVNTDKQIVSSITKAVDVWSFCCLVSYLFSGYPPWCNKYKDKPEIIQKALTKKEEFPIPPKIDSKIAKIIKIGTIIDYTQRASMSDIDEIVQNL